MLFPKTSKTNEETFKNYLASNSDDIGLDKNTIKAIIDCQQMRMKMMILIGRTAPFSAEKSSKDAYLFQSAAKKGELKALLDEKQDPLNVLQQKLMHNELVFALQTAEKEVEKLLALQKEYKELSNGNLKDSKLVEIQTTKKDIIPVINECKQKQKEIIELARMVEGIHLISKDNQYQDKPKIVTSTVLNYALMENTSNFLSSVDNLPKQFNSKQLKKYDEVTYDLKKSLEDINDSFRKNFLESQKNIKNIKATIASTPEDEKDVKHTLESQLMQESSQLEERKKMFDLSTQAYNKFSASIENPSATSSRQKIQEVMNIQDIVIKFSSTLTTSLTKDPFIEASQSDKNEKVIKNVENLLTSNVENKNPSILKECRLLSFALQQVKQAKFDLETSTEKNLDVRQALNKTYERALNNCLVATKKVEKQLSSPSLTVAQPTQSSTAIITLSAQIPKESIRKNLIIDIPEKTVDLTAPDSASSNSKSPGPSSPMSGYSTTIPETPSALDNSTAPDLDRTTSASSLDSSQRENIDSTATVETPSISRGRP